MAQTQFLSEFESQVAHQNRRLFIMSNKTDEVPSHTYKEWDTPEKSDKVFDMLISGEMNRRGFANWVNQVKIDECRYLFPM